MDSFDFQQYSIYLRILIFSLVCIIVINVYLFDIKTEFNKVSWIIALGFLAFIARTGKTLNL